jgi:acetoin utilization deacetylase AcuC-like enzyme
MMLAIYTHPSFLKHDTGPGHPERAARLEVILELLDEMKLETIPAREASWSELSRAHPESYLMALQDAIPDHGRALLDADTAISSQSWDAAAHAAGSVCQAVDDVLAGKTKRAFCAVRPPGHHAMPGNAEGFCLLANISIGALHALQKLKRIAVVDFDVHHGNGTDAIARKHDGFFFASTHQWPMYPGTGLPEDDVPGRVVNRPLAANSGSTEFRAAWNEILKHLDAFKPELVLISAGFDAHRDDPLAQINLTEDDYSWITGELVKIADKHANGRIVSALEGGYDLAALKNSVAAHIKTLA